jgi:hypothetical protein
MPAYNKLREPVKCYLRTRKEVIALGLNPDDEPCYVSEMNRLAVNFKDKLVLAKPLYLSYVTKSKRYNCKGYTWDERWLRFEPQQLEFDFSQHK